MSGKNLRVNLIANTSQFKSAMTESSNQIKLLNSEFKSAAAETDKYGNKLDQTGAKKKQLNGIIEQYRTRIVAIKNEQRHWTNELKKGNVTETEHAQKQQELARRLNNTEAEMKRYEGQLKRINAEGKATTRTYADFDKQFRQVGTTMRNVGAQVGITAGVGFMAMKRVLGDVVNEAKDLYAQMSEVKAISGATGAEMEKLTQQSKDLGKATKFTAQEAAESQANLARAGFNTNEIMGAMPGLLDLAASSNLELGTSADITANIIRTFGFEAEKAGKVADVLAKGAASANTDVQGIGNSMKTAGPVAKSLGIQFESVAAATGLMADSGIAGEQAGRMLRQGMLRLSKPTGEAGKLIEKMGVDVFDASGNMKSLDKVVAELQVGMKGYTGQQKAAALATIFGSESTAGWTVLLDQGADSLKKYTTDLENSEGAAKAMADTMQDNAEGSIIRMQSALSGLKIELGEKLLPTLAKGADLIGDLANKMSEWDESTVQTIAESALLVTAVLGVTTVVAGLVTGIGAFMAVAGPVGLAITAGTLLLGGLAAAVYKNKLETEQSNKVNLENAKSLSEQAAELENSADTFDKLSDKAKISNSELAQLHDINQRIARGGSSDEISKLQHQYDKLAEKSGLSKEELEKLFGANDDIIKQSPNVEQSISEQGNAFAKNTEKVREYLNTLDEMSHNELTNERTVALEREAEIIEEITKQKEEQKRLDQELGLYEEARNMSEIERLSRIEEINGLYRDMTISEEEKTKLKDEQVRLMNVETGHYREVTLEIRDQMIEKAKSIEKNEEELFLIKQIDTELANIKLRRLSINEEGERGLIVLEEALAKNHETLANLDAELEKNGELTEEQQKQKESVTGRVEQLQDAQNYINTELELYGSVNSLVESQKHLLSEGTQEKIKSLENTLGIEIAEGNILQQIQEKNARLVEERDQLEKNRELQGANKEEIDRQIAAIDEKINAGDGVVLQMLKELDILELVRDGIILNGTELQSYLEGLGYSTEEAFKLAQQLSGETVKALEEGVEGAEKAGEGTGGAYDKGLSSKKPSIDSTAESIRISTEDELGSSTDGDGGKSSGTQYDSGLASQRSKIDSTSRSIKTSTEYILGSTTDDGGGKSAGTQLETGLDSKKGGIDGSSTALKLLVSTILGSATDGDGGTSSGSMFNAGILSFKGQVNTSGTNVATSGRDGLASVKTSQTGTDFVSGFSGAISSGGGVGGSVWTAAANLGRSALRALKGAIDSHSPSEETREEGINFTDGFILAIRDGFGPLNKSALKFGMEAVTGLADGIKNKKDEVDTVTVRLTKQIEKITKKSNDEINTINKKAKAEASKLEKRSQEDINIIYAKAKKAKRKLTQQETVRIRRLEEDTAAKVKKVYEKSKKDVEKIEKDKVKKLDEAREKEFQNSKDWIERKKEQQDLSLIDELAAWERVQKRYEEGTKQRIEADKNVLQMKEEIHDKLMSLNDEYITKMQDVNDEYEQKVEQRMQSIRNSFGLFDEVKSGDTVYGDNLIDNLQDQVKELENWSENLKKLAKRGIDEGLLKELQEMGPKSASEIEAFVEMTDEQMLEFEELWRTKSELAKEQALYELEDLKEKSEEKLEELQEEWISKIEEIRYGTKNEFRNMPTDLNRIGNQAITGMIHGMESMRGPLISQARSLAEAIKIAMQEVLGIKSPSTVMHDEVGQWVPAGVAGGIESNIGMVKNAMNKMSEAFNVRVADFKMDFGKLAFAVEESKQSLKVEHEIKQTGVEKLLLQLIDAIKNGGSEKPLEKNEYNIYSSDDAESIARAIERAERRMAFRMG